MALVSMATEDDAVYAPSEPNPYGYGLCLRLTEEQVEALGLAANPPKPGTKVGLRAMAFVQCVNQELDDDADPDDPNGIDVCMTLQVTDLEVTPAGAGTTQDAASMLYSS